MIYTDQELLSMYAISYSLNKTQLSNDLGISRPTLNLYLSGKRPLPLIFKKYIALDLNIPIKDLDFDFLSNFSLIPTTRQSLTTLPW